MRRSVKTPASRAGTRRPTRTRRHRQPVRQPVDQVWSRRSTLIATRRFASACACTAAGRPGRGVDALVLHAVAGHELLAHRPELLGVHGPGGAVAGRVDLAVAAALLRARTRPCSAPGRGWRRAASSTSGDRAPLHAVLGAGDPPAVGREPVDRRARDHARGRPGVDAEVVPVDHEDQVVQAQAPGGVLGLVGRAGVSPPSPSNTKTFTSPAPASFRASASPAAGMPCPDGPVLNFRNSVLPSISACPGRPPRRRSLSSHSQVSAQRPSSGNANSAAPVRRAAPASPR